VAGDWGRGWGGRGRGKEKREGEEMWRGPESGLPRGPRWLSAGLSFGTESATVTNFRDRKPQLLVESHCQMSMVVSDSTHSASVVYITVNSL